MENLNLNNRTMKASHYGRRCRRMGKVPGVLYGKEMSNFLFEVGEMELNDILSKSGEHGIISVVCNGGAEEALIKEIQKDPVTHKVIHLDLEKVTNGKKVISEVPIVFKGEGLVNKGGAIVQKEKSNVKVSCDANKLPKSFEVDLSGLTPGKVIKLSDMEVGSEISILDDINSVIVSVSNEQKVPEVVEVAQIKEAKQEKNKDLKVENK